MHQLANTSSRYCFAWFFAVMFVGKLDLLAVLIFDALTLKQDLAECAIGCHRTNIVKKSVAIPKNCLLDLNSVITKSWRD